MFFAFAFNESFKHIVDGYVPQPVRSVVHNFYFLTVRLVKSKACVCFVGNGS